MNRNGLLFAFFVLAVYCCVYGRVAVDPGECVQCPENLVCPPLSRRFCEVARRPCGCCDECAGRKRAKCSAYTVRCDSRFKCVNKDGFELENIPFDSKFEGICIKRARKGKYPLKTRFSRRFSFRG